MLARVSLLHFLTFIQTIAAIIVREAIKRGII